MGNISCEYKPKHCCQVDLSHETNSHLLNNNNNAQGSNNEQHSPMSSIASPYNNNKYNDMSPINNNDNNVNYNNNTPKPGNNAFMFTKTINSYKTALMEEHSHLETLKAQTNLTYTYQQTLNNPKANFKRFNLPSSPERDFITSSTLPSRRKSFINTQTLQVQRQGFRGEKKQLRIVKSSNASKENFDMIKKCFNKHFFLECFDIKTQLKMIKEMMWTSIESNQIVCLEGTQSELFYVVKSGQLEVSKDNDYAYLKHGDCFGERALISTEPRAETIKALSKCEFWVLERDTFNKYLKIETHANVQVNLQFVKRITVFSLLASHQQLLIAEMLRKNFYMPGQFIVHKGDDADCVFVIAEGVIACCASGKEVCILRQGDIFGERSAMLDSKRTLDVVAKTNAVCFSIANCDLSQVLGKNYRSELFFHYVKFCFLKSEYFKDMEMNLLLNVIDLFSVRTMNKGVVVFKKGERKAAKICVMIDGSLYDESDVVAKQRPLAKGTLLLFGKELYLNSKDVFKENVYADPDCLLFEAEANEIEEKLNVTFKEIVDKSRNCKLLKDITFLRDVFTVAQIEAISVKLNYKRYKKGDRIYNKEDDAMNLWILRKGCVIVGDKEIKSVKVFGMNALSNEQCYNENAFANGECECLFISRKKIVEIIGENYYTYIKGIFTHKINSTVKALKDFEFYFDLPSPSHNNFISVVSHKYAPHLHYAIKCIPKYLLIKQNLYNTIEMRDKVLTSVNYPFILKYFKSFTEKNCIFCLKEYISCININTLLQRHHSFIESISTNQIKAYMATLLLACSFLHKKRIIYRNISPDGVVLRDNGFLCLMNFDYSKRLTTPNEDYTCTKLGIPHYMSPEAITGERYSFDIDYWGIAVFVYQLAFGELPFGKSHSEPMNVYFDIINKEVSFPFKQETSKATQNALQNFQYLIRSMLRKNRLLRLARFEDIKRHDWFEEFNWDELEEMKTLPEYIPDIVTVGSSSNIANMKSANGAYLRHFIDTMKDVSLIYLYETLTDKEKKGIDEWYKTF